MRRVSLDKCEQWEEKNVRSSFSRLEHTAEPFLSLTSRRITAPECRTVYLVSMLQEAAAIYCMYTDEVVSDTPRRPCRTARCDLCSLAPNEPHWQAALRLYVSFSLNETINMLWSDLQSDVTTLATCFASSGFIIAFYNNLLLFNYIKHS